MSKISLLIEQPTINSTTLYALKSLTEKSLSQLNENINNGVSVFNANLFYNNHKEVAIVLLKIVELFQQEEIKFSIYELEENEVLDRNLHQINVITVETLTTILSIEDYE